MIALGFASTILLGTLLLLMPFSIRSGITVQPVDALFSATSAVCVTGLLTVDTADTFTPVGQAVMAVLIQIGGLGITSIGMGLALAAGRRISLRERTLIREAMNVSSLEGMVRLVRAIIKLTLAFELAGVIPIFAVFAQDYPPLKALGLSVFHSISSFNNAGIDILGGGRRRIEQGLFIFLFQYLRNSSQREAAIGIFKQLIRDCGVCVFLNKLRRCNNYESISARINFVCSSLKLQIHFCILCFEH